jgi:hypothetical protein
VMPSYETIRDRAYRYVTEVYAVTRNAMPADSGAGKLLAWLRSADGQAVVRESGYVPVAEPPAEYFATHAGSARHLDMLAAIRRDLPSGWDCMAVWQDGDKGHPHGLDEPLFRMDVGSTYEVFGAGLGRGLGSGWPLVQLFFYDIAEKPHVLNVIEAERLHSWDIPIYFGETDQYVIVTSPAYVNHGIFTDEAKKRLSPGWQVLRRHIPNKGDTSVDELVELR